MKKMNKTPLAAAMGAALISSLGVTAVQAEANPFAMSEMSSGYMQLAEGEMKCGASMGMAESKNKTAEGACAGSTASSSSKSTAAAAKKADGSCGENKCGAMMKDGKMKPGMENACGAMMKGKEGACGTTKATDNKAKEGKCGAQCQDGMKNCAAAKAKEGACGAQMKGCGENMQGCADMMKGMGGNCGANMKMDGEKAAPAAPTAPAK